MRHARWAVINPEFDLTGFANAALLSQGDFLDAGVDVELLGLLHHLARSRVVGGPGCRRWERM